MDVLSIVLFLLVSVSIFFTMYALFCFAKLQANGQTLERLLAVERQRVTDLRHEMIQFMKVVHSKWEHDDQLQAKATAGTVEPSTPVQ